MFGEPARSSMVKMTESDWSGHLEVLHHTLKHSWPLWRKLIFAHEFLIRKFNMGSWQIGKSNWKKKKAFLMSWDFSFMSSQRNSLQCIKLNLCMPLQDLGLTLWEKDETVPILRSSACSSDVLWSLFCTEHREISGECDSVFY